MPKQKILFSILVVIAIISGVGLAVYFQNRLKANFVKNSLNTNRIENSTETNKKANNQARAPLKIPEDSIIKGRTVIVPILMYHHVGDTPKNANATRLDLTVKTADFAEQVKWLNEQGYQSISLKNLFDFSQKKFTLPKKPVIFTFDDGYDDVFINAVPILDQYGFKGSFGIITNNPGTTQGDNVYASWDEIAKALSDGQEIVSHTQDHFDGSNLKYSADFIAKNLTGSITDIKNHLGFTTNILIYPFGHYTPEYLKQAKLAGLVMGITVHEGDLINLDDLMEVPRVRVHGKEDLKRFQDIILHNWHLSGKAPTASTTPASPYGK